MITAIILISTARGRNPEVAQALVDMPKITEVYSVAGEYDLVAIARVQRHDDLADLVTDKVQQLPGITSTNTLIAFKTYSKRISRPCSTSATTNPRGNRVASPDLRGGSVQSG